LSLCCQFLGIWQVKVWSRPCCFCGDSISNSMGRMRSTYSPNLEVKKHLLYTVTELLSNYHTHYWELQRSLSWFAISANKLYVLNRWLVIAEIRKVWKKDYYYNFSRMINWFEQLFVQYRRILYEFLLFLKPHWTCWTKCLSYVQYGRILY
jgi:hypothetical protein